MNTYKITNITNLFGKRDSKFNSIVNIEYVDNRTKKIISLNPNQTIYLTVQSLPLSVRKMNMKKMIDITIVSDIELKKMTKKPEKIVVKEKKKNVKSEEKEKKKIIRK